MGTNDNRTGTRRLLTEIRFLLLLTEAAVACSGVSSARKVILQAATPRFAPQPQHGLCFGTLGFGQVSTHHIRRNADSTSFQTVDNSRHWPRSTRSMNRTVRFRRDRPGCPDERYAKFRLAVKRLYNSVGIPSVSSDTRAEEGSEDVRSLPRINGHLGSPHGVSMLALQSVEGNDDTRRRQGSVHASKGLGPLEATAPRVVDEQALVSFERMESHPGEESTLACEAARSLETAGIGAVPRHVAFIMDGNGRWATKRNLARTVGHIQGVLRAEEVVEACREFGVEFVTLYVFSTENWKRPAAEVSFIMELLEDRLQKTREKLRRWGVRFTTIGETHMLPPGLRTIVRELEQDGLPEMVIEGVDGDASVKVGRAEPAKMTLCLAISYGGRTEVAAAARELAMEVAAGKLDPSEINEETFGRRLSTARLGIPDPDLVIRTSGESRLSNLLLWQAAYSELYVVNTLWPEFRRRDLLEAFRVFGKRKRRFGKTDEQVATR